MTIIQIKPIVVEENRKKKSMFSQLQFIFYDDNYIEHRGFLFIFCFYIGGLCHRETVKTYK